MSSSAHFLKRRADLKVDIAEGGFVDLDNLAVIRHEANHLRQKNAITEAEDFQELIDLQAQNKTVREIASEWNKRNRQETNRSCAITGETWLIFLVFRPL